MITIAITIDKGGSAKSTTAINLAHFLAISGNRVLLVDADQNSHCAFMLGLDPSKDAANLFNPEIDLDRTGILRLCRSSVRPDQDFRMADGSLIRVRPMWRERLSVVTSSRGSIIAMRSFIANEANSSDEAGDRVYGHLSTRLAQIDNDFDYCVIDCPPGVDALQRNIINCANIFVIPCTFGAADLTGATSYIKSVDKELKRSAVNAAAKDCCIVLPTRQIHSVANNGVLASGSAKILSEHGVRTSSVRIPEREVARKASEYGITCYERASISRLDDKRGFVSLVTNDNDVAEGYSAFALEQKLVGAEPKEIHGATENSFA